MIYHEIRLKGSKGEKTINALFDTASTYSVIRKDIAKDLDIFIKIPDILKLETAKEKNEIVATEAIRVDFYIDGYRFSDEFIIIDELSEPVIIGIGTLQKWHLKLDIENKNIIIDPNATRLKLL